MNALDILVEGNNHSIDIAQIGDDNIVTGSNGEAMLIEGSDITLSISQTGLGNIVEGSITNASGSVSITQVGDWNSATITQK